MYALLKLQYRMRRITAADVWGHVDTGDITAEQATLICGPRP